MRFKRKSYSRENITNIENNNNVSDINPLICYSLEEHTEIIREISLEEYRNDKNINFLKEYKIFLNQLPTHKVRTLNKSLIKPFVLFMEKENIFNIKDFNYSFLLNFKINLSNFYNSTVTKNRFYSCVIAFIQFLRRTKPELLHEDCINFDVPSRFRITHKTAVEKDLEHLNHSYNDIEYNLLLNESARIIITESSSYNDKIVAFFLIISMTTGANKEVLFSFTNDDLIKICNDFDYIDFNKIKNKKGIGANIKVKLKNYTFQNISNIKISDLANIIYKQKQNLNLNFKYEKHKNDLFTFIPQRKSKKDMILKSFKNDYVNQVKYFIKHNNINFTETFNLSRCRKHYERKIYSFTNNLQITSSLLGHHEQVANRNYLNTSSNTESHQKLALTQDTLKGFSTNSETDNWVTYQELLDFFNITLEDALKLSKEGFDLTKIRDKQNG